MKNLLLFAISLTTLLLAGCGTPNTLNNNSSITSGNDITIDENTTSPFITKNGYAVDLNNVTTGDRLFGPTGDHIIISGENALLVSGNVYTFFNTFFLTDSPIKPHNYKERYRDSGLKKIGITNTPYSTRDELSTILVKTSKLNSSLTPACSEDFSEGPIVSKEKKTITINNHKTTSIFIVVKVKHHGVETNEAVGKMCFSVNDIVYEIVMTAHTSASIKELFNTLQFIE